MSIDRLDAKRRAPGVAAGPYLAATWFGVGYIPLAPGTMATATVLPIYWLLRFASMPLQLGVVAVLALLSVFCAHRVAIDQGQDDPQIVVIDEVTGALAGLILVDTSSLALQLTVLALFRVLDIFKPWPINVGVGRHAGFNIVYDDLLAGLCSGLIVRLVLQFVL